MHMYTQMADRAGRRGFNLYVYIYIYIYIYIYNIHTHTHKKMAGRAGRRGFDLRGNIVFMGIRREKIKRLQNSELPTLSGNLLLTSSVGLRFLIKHASIRTAQVHVHACIRFFCAVFVD
jgi:superfamily II RNA helicase